MEGADDQGSESHFEEGRKDDSGIVKKLIKLIVNKKRPLSLCDVIENIDDDKEKIIAMFNNNTDKFSIYNKLFVDLKIKVEICKQHCSKQKCLGDSDCSSLHICKPKVLSGSCSFGNKCSFGHDLTTNHNRKVLDENYLSNISLTELSYLFTRDINRIVPEICKFYNVGNDKCKHKGQNTACPFLHVCKHYVYGTCKFKICRRSHNILAQDNVDILKNHGIDTARKEKDVLKELRMILKQNRQKSVFELDNTESISLPADTRVVDRVKKEPGELDISLSSDNSDDNMNQPFDVLKMKQEPTVGEESRSPDNDDPRVCVDISPDCGAFRYKSQLEPVVKKAKSKQDGQIKQGNGCLASVAVTNYKGIATVVAFCVDGDDNLHPFYLHGTNCEDGVYKHKCLIESDTPVKLLGVSVIMPRVKEYQDNVNARNAYLNNCDVIDTKLCNTIKDKQSVFLKVIVFLEDCDNRSISGTSSIIRNKSYSRKQRENENSGEKRAFECNDNNVNAKRRKESRTDSFLQDKRLFQRFYSQPNASAWGNFVDTSGYEESALMWQAHGEALQSVCKICFPGGSATGFRVGFNKNYIMTAAHVVGLMEQTGIRRIGRPNRASLSNASVYAVFGYLKEGEIKPENKFTFTGNVHFRNAETDIAVLELSQSAYGTPMPPPLSYFRAPDTTQEFFFIGHSEGKPLGINKVDKIVDMNSKESKFDRGNVRLWSKDHTKCIQYPQGRDYELEPFGTLTNKHRFLFHCKFTKGASGSPGIVCLNDGRKVVVTVLLCGYPEWFYDPSMDNFKASWSQDRLCIEQGVKLQSVYEIMNKENVELCTEIFGHETDD